MLSLRVYTVLAAIMLSLSNPTVANAFVFGTPYLVGETSIPLNVSNIPSKLHAVTSYQDSFISAISPLGDVNALPAFHAVRGNILYITPHRTGSMYMQVEETRADGQKVVSRPILFTFYQVTFQAEACHGFNQQENFGSVSPVQPMRFSLVGIPTKTNPDNFQVSLSDATLGNINTSMPGIVEISYKKSGKAILKLIQNTSLGEVILNQLSLEFIASKSVVVNFYHIHDPAGYSAWRLRQTEMIAYLQQTEKILNQAGITITIGEQKDVYLPNSVGFAVDAASDAISFEENLVVQSSMVNPTAAASVFFVWDYTLDRESKVGMNYRFPGVGNVIFITDQTLRPGETLAHEIGHALGLTHNNLGPTYLMAAQEYSDTQQCNFSYQELRTLISSV
ncbi:MAG: hypothetical protein HY817_00495 [Candidatus Abawacabacteria bacterium]|nr:hypothetical protein [Candidatus Abawacabacteria bacterium]